MGKTITQYHTAKRHDVRLIRDPDEIEEMTDEYSENPRPRCGKCKNPTEILRGYDGREVGRWCKADGYFWVRRELERTITVVDYVPWEVFDERKTG